MQRRISMRRDDSGQTLIYVAISMMVLLGFVALAVDVGHLYAERRHMQNAADAGALEAARARCFDNAGAGDAAAAGAAFMEANNVRPDAIGHLYTVAPRANQWEFDATAEEAARPFFAGVIGLASVSVRATASAACGATERTCGLFPLAFDKAIWDNVGGQCGKTFYVWTSDKEDPADEGKTFNCDICDCTKVYIKNKLQPEVIAIAETGRAWLDFTSAGSALTPGSCAGKNGCGAAELKCWVGGKSPGQLTLDPANPPCVSGTSGAKLGVRNEVNKRVGDFVNLPIYDGKCTPDEGVKGECKEGFKLVKFGCMEVQKWENQKVEIKLKITPTPPPKGPKPSDTCIEAQMMPVKVACDKCNTECGKVTGGGDPGSGIKAVSLIP